TVNPSRSTAACTTLFERISELSQERSEAGDNNTRAARFPSTRIREVDATASTETVGSKRRSRGKGLSATANGRTALAATNAPNRVPSETSDRGSQYVGSASSPGS